MDIQAPLFTLAELCRATGLDRGVANMWLRRGHIQPTRSEQLPIRKRALFSVFAIFQLKLVQLMAECTAMSPSEALDFSKRITTAMWSVARESDRGRTLELLAGVSKDRDRWRLVFPVLDERKLARQFGQLSPYIVIPVGEIFAEVYRKCQAIYASTAAEGPARHRRA